MLSEGAEEYYTVLLIHRNAVKRVDNGVPCHAIVLDTPNTTYPRQQPTCIERERNGRQRRKGKGKKIKRKQIPKKIIPGKNSKGRPKRGRNNVPPA